MGHCSSSFLNNLLFATSVFENLYLARGRGEPVSIALADEVKILQSIPLDEGPGEGYHRQTHLTMERAQASSAPWVMASVRHKQSLDLNKTLLNTYGEKGAKVFKYEWRNFKRVLQPSMKNKWRNVRMTDGKFYNKLYRLDEVADEDNWDDAFRDVGSGPNQRPPPDSATKVKSQYLVSVYKEKSFYSFPTSRSEVAGDGQLHDVAETVYFQVLGVYSPQGRMQRIASAHEETDVLSTARTAICAQYLEKWEADPEREDRREDNVVTAFFDTDPFYINILDIVPFQVAASSMAEWDSNASSTRDCIDLKNPRRTHLQFDALGDNVPAYVPLRALRDIGWTSRAGKVIHDRESPRILDIRSVQSKVLYLQTLLRLPELLDVNATVHSGEPPTYYALVLQQVKVEAGLGRKTYVDMLAPIIKGMPALGNGDADDEPHEPEPIALEDGNDNDDSSDGGFELGGGDPVPARRRRRAKAAPKPKALSPDGKARPNDGPASPSSDPSDKASDSSTGSSSSVTSDGSFALAGKGARSEVSGWFQIPNGPKIKLDKYKPVGKRVYLRIIAQCGVHGKACEKKRNVTHCVSLGKGEPIAYLSAWWELASTCSRDKHTQRNFRVPMDLVRTWHARIGSSADAFLDRF